MDPARATGEDHMKSQGFEPYDHDEKPSFIEKIKENIRYFFKDLFRKKF